MSPKAEGDGVQGLTMALVGCPWLMAAVEIQTYTLRPKVLHCLAVVSKSLKLLSPFRKARAKLV